MSDLSGNFADLAALAAADAPPPPSADLTTWTSEEESEVTFITKGIPPTALYVPSDALLLVRIFSTIATSAIITVRLMRPDGTIMTGQRGLAALALGSLGVFTVTLTEGFLLDVSVEGGVFNTHIPRGAVFVSVGMTRSTKFNSIAEMALVSGYVCAAFPLGWPAGKLAGSFEGQGRIRVIQGTSPGFFNNINEALPTSSKWRLISMNFTFQTDANAGARFVEIVLQDAGGNNFFEQFSPVAQNPSTQVRYNASAAPYVQGVNPSVVALPIPPNAWMDGGFITTFTTGINVGDSYSSINYQVEEWINP